MHVHDPDLLWMLERRLWLEGHSTFEAVLARDARLVFPWPTGVLDRAATLAALRDAPRWREVEFAARHAIALGADAALLVYAVRACHDGDSDAYTASCTSAYRRVGDAWQLVLHQQTPDDAGGVTIEAVDVAT